MVQLNYRNGLSAALIAAIVACALWIGYVAGWGEGAPLASTQPAAPQTKLEEIRLAPDYAGPGPDLAETTARPLFNASRRPLPGEAQTGSATSGALPRGRYTLTGVSISQGTREALLRDDATNTTVRVEQSKEVGGILVESVTPTKVILKLGSEREEISLRIAPASKVAAVTPPKPDQALIPGPPQGGLPAITPLVRTQPVAPAPPGAPPAAADIANADPITDADVAERAARVQARRNRQSTSGETVSK